MKVCFPVQTNEGIESKVYNHFGSAPMFVVVDTETNAVSIINNKDEHHAHGACNPIKALDGQNVDAIVVGGIGAGALTRLNQSGIRVYRSQAENIGENVLLFSTKKLSEFSVQGCCGGHDAGGGCAH
ncbi:MAG: diguanylate cyclase [Nitrospirae bacterium GWC2_57_13]|jgi:predicted Fe-Mo cluster-binding NifX family protein|nr:MAG: diguanylate cyclase [Nitrospirae bacterium GWC1_57_7]OGW27768.1 MAG: diguanylate cyclase [Nitrospirae bacterium GWC2_57_13]HAR45177.1 diguanylate cyclase [Nitrospiraceae bacterium]HAS53432.1 diguanylate cyclase [Nitrospiraceae bacterium]